ncbi:hypothetical protein E2C01_054848 [Portunus trituberculatus]|uniref:Uncharacterized protein n=1 Tax=Portunus trituberculatus TaxID=210409 RepID=A0A5B7GKX2_PORTR|nr:hypothetical protein [Portunus trituberculatus]
MNMETRHGTERVNGDNSTHGCVLANIPHLLYSVVLTNDPFLLPTPFFTPHTTCYSSVPPPCLPLRPTHFLTLITKSLLIFLSIICCCLISFLFILLFYLISTTAFTSLHFLILIVRVEPSLIPLNVIWCCYLSFL